jgi:hypothetical protein
MRAPSRYHGDWVPGTLPGPSRQCVRAALGSGQRPRRRGASLALTESALPRNAERSRGYFWRRELQPTIRPARLLGSCVPVNILCATGTSKSHPIKYSSALPGTEEQIVTPRAGEVDCSERFYSLCDIDEASWTRKKHSDLISFTPWGEVARTATAATYIEAHRPARSGYGISSMLDHEGIEGLVRLFNIESKSDLKKYCCDFVVRHADFVALILEARAGACHRISTHVASSTKFRHTSGQPIRS